MNVLFSATFKLCDAVKSADVPMWLKSLRLHKYTQMLQQMGYDEMMALDERKLEALNVTKGARKKIMQSIQKLRERVPMLKQMEKVFLLHFLVLMK